MSEWDKLLVMVAVLALVSIGFFAIGFFNDE